MENRGLPLRSIISHSLWITLVGILLFSLSTTRRHNFGYTKFFSICGTLLMTIPWIIQLLVTSAVILLHKSIGYNLMWVVRPQKSSKENHHPTNVVTISSSSPSSLTIVWPPQRMVKMALLVVELFVIVKVSVSWLWRTMLLVLTVVSGTCFRSSNIDIISSLDFIIFPSSCLLTDLSTWAMVAWILQRTGLWSLSVTSMQASYLLTQCIGRWESRKVKEDHEIVWWNITLQYKKLQDTANCTRKMGLIGYLCI